MGELAVYFYILTCISGPTCKPGEDLPASKFNDGAQFSLSTCEHDARLVAQSMFVTTHNKYGYRCVLVDYDPPKMPQSGEKQ